MRKSKHLDLSLEGSETLSITFFVFVKFMLKGFSPQVLVLIPFLVFILYNFDIYPLNFLFESFGLFEKYALLFF
jgi:hypothetical protein